MSEVLLDDEIETDKFHLTKSMHADLRQAFKWMKIVSMIQMGFIVIVLIGGILVVKQNNMTGFITILISCVAFYIVYVLFQSSQNFVDFDTSKKAKYLEKCFRRQKYFWLWTGVSSMLMVASFLYNQAVLFSLI